MSTCGAMWGNLGISWIPLRMYWIYGMWNIFDRACVHSPEKAMAPHSSTLAWNIPWMEEPGRLQSMGSLSRARLSDFTFTHWRRKWQPTPVFLPGESQGPQSLVGCRLWGRTELDRTEATEQQQQQQCSFSILPPPFDRDQSLLQYLHWYIMLSMQ